MAKNLLIVESPAKAKTIEKYLGSDFKVKSSMGHIRDLNKKEGAIDVENDFAPKYEVTPDKRRTVSDLKSWVKKVDHVWLATDEDREGEAISWHLCKVLGLDEKTTKRIVFREITKPAVQKAIQAPRTVDLDLVDAQQARRILDRLVGYELSGVLWKKVKGNLSAGRVQSVAVKLVVEREREIQEFDSKPFYRINALFHVKSETGKVSELKAELPKKFNDEATARDFLQNCVGAEFTIGDILKKPLKRRPTPPFTTSTLQQEASRKLYFNVKRTMRVAQRLYEAGHITYMRTDSTNLSELAIAAIAEEIEKNYGANYVQTRRFKSKKNANAQEAHEAIRPTYFQKRNVSGDREEQRLYELIWKRTVASQMAEAKLEKTTVEIDIDTIKEHRLRATGEVLKFDGFLKVYLEGTDDDDEEDNKSVLPPLNVGQALDLNEMTATQRFSRPPSRFTEASLVKRMEELGIGRPSTYAPTITKIMDPTRGYVVKGESEGTERKYQVMRLSNDQLSEEMQTEMTGSNKNRLVPTDMGMLVTDFLNQHFKDIMNYNFTADVESEFDKIAEGQKEWTKMLQNFYVPFHSTVEKTVETAERASGERILGTDPKSGRTLLVRMSRYGPVAQIGAPDELAEDEKPVYANFKRGQSLESISFEEAVELFKLPRTVGEYDGEEIVIASGRYGPYIKFDGKFISLPKGSDPLETTREEAIELIEERRKQDAPVAMYKDLPVTQGKGRFGPFLKWNGFFANISKKYDPDNLSQEEILEIVAAKEKKEAERYIKRWAEEKIDLEMGRWGPFIRWNKKSIKIPKVDGERVTREQADEMTLSEVKELIEADYPDAFKKKTRKKAAPKKKATKKAAKKPAAKKK